MSTLEERLLAQGMNPRETLERLYLIEKKGCKAIGKGLGVTAMTVHKYLRRYGIQTRSLTEALKLQDKRGSNNPMYGKHLSQEAREAKSRHLKELIAQRGHHWTKGKTLSDEAKKHISQATRGENNPRWRGGRRRKTDGYIEVYAPDHPYGNKTRRTVYEHRLVMEKHLGRYLLPDEIVHHLNGDQTDNRLENLELVTVEEHARIHYPAALRDCDHTRLSKSQWSLNYDRCRRCGKVERPHRGSGLCDRCYNNERYHGRISQWQMGEKGDNPDGR